METFMNEIIPVSILLVEDDPGHSRLIQKNLKRAGISKNLYAVDDGQKAIDFLFSEGEYKGIPRPENLLVLLDLNLPVLSGYQVLKLMKETQSAKNIPVIILTTTADNSEIRKCYELGCNIYVSKPVNYEDFAQAIQNLGLFISVIKIPNNE